MGVKTLLKWSKQITPSKVEQLLRAERDLRKVKIIFDSASAEYSNGFRHDHTTFGVMISKLVSANEFRPAEEMLNRMKEEKCRVTEEIFLSICRGYGRVHLPLDAIRVFHKMNDFGCKPTDKSYISVFAILVEENQLKLNNTVVQGLCTNGNLNRAFQLYLGMRTRGISIDAGTFDSLVKCFCKKGDLHKSVRIFDEMVLDGCVPDHGIWSAVVGGFWDRRKVREAFELIVVELMNEFVEHE
ncbi:hypothetical protein OIU76_026233 [Salix suchowensis]|nr:hypothetical protein OIU76_026233 [Salix suchowensis]